MSVDRPRVMADGPLDPTVVGFLNDQVEIVPWSTSPDSDPSILGLYTYGHPSVDGAMLDRFPSLKVISNYGVGVDHIQLEAAEQRSIPVGNTPDILNGATADQAWALMLAVGRRVVEGDHYARGAHFTAYDPGHMLGVEIHGTTLGILGMGRIGQEIAKRAAGFDMSVIYHNRRPREEAASLWGATWRTLDELLAESDYLVLSCPLTEATRHLIGKDQLAKMKASAILINVARGGVVDTRALTEALSKQQIRGAGLDVTEPEPLPRDHALLKLDNVVITPHLGSATMQTRRLMAQLSVSNLMHGLQDTPLIKQVHAE